MGRLKEKITVSFEFHHVDGRCGTQNNPMIKDISCEWILLVVSGKGRLDLFVPLGALKWLGVQCLEGVKIQLDGISPLGECKQTRFL